MTPEPWKRNQYVTVATVFVVFTGFAFVLPFLPLYVKELGVTDPERAALWAGVLIGTAPLVAGLMAPVWGRLADRYGHKPMALRALGSYVVLLALSAAVADVWQLFALRLGIGLFGGIGPLGLAMATSLAPREHTGRAVGSVQAAQILSAAVGPLAGGLLADAIGIRRTFLATAGLCAAAFVLVLRGYREPAAAPRSRAQAGGGLRDVLGARGVPGLLVVLFLVNFVSRSFTPILPLQLLGFGVAPDGVASATGLLISAYSVAAAASATLLGRASRRLAPRRLLVASLLAGAMTVLPMGLVGGFTPFLALAVALGLLSGGALTLSFTIGGSLVPEAHRTTAFGFFSAAALFGGSVSPSVAGAIAHWDLRGTYYLGALIFAGLGAALAPGAVRAAAPASEEPAGP